ncbi:sialic acid-binding Ig-like lectin 13 [Labeo rohita]|uniref:Sialic acid-binding Ig-like lectin 13 n=1 Tax=Labeo rohita TaxID=84645 RepID=A0A498LRB6_LABRO|nr:sialic acid-binding Ig-like lectin 13 [Labeo rohita]
MLSKLLDTAIDISLNLFSVLIGVAVVALVVVLFAVTCICLRLSTKQRAHNEAAGTYESLQLSAPPSEYDTLNIKRGLNLFSVLIGVAVVALVVVLFAVTCICLRLSTKQRAQNEAAGTYASVYFSAPPSEYETLNIRRDAPKISPSSRCVRTDVPVCFCEADGNPFSELRWHLSGRPATNSSNTLISEERLSSTDLRSSITLHQSLTHTFTLQCVSNNTHGNASQLFHLPSSVASLNLFSVLIGVAVVALVVVLFAVTCICLRLSTKQRAQNEAAGTYASLQLSAPPSEYDTLNIKRDTLPPSDCMQVSDL